MPALMVRDFPSELHEKLKEEAKLKHRSMAQQLIAVMEEHYAHEQPVPPRKPMSRAELLEFYGYEEPITLRRPMSEEELKRWRREGAA